MSFVCICYLVTVISYLFQSPLLRSTTSLLQKTALPDQSGVASKAL